VAQLFSGRLDSAPPVELAPLSPYGSRPQQRISDAGPSRVWNWWRGNCASAGSGSRFVVAIDEHCGQYRSVAARLGLRGSAAGMGARPHIDNAAPWWRRTRAASDRLCRWRYLLSRVHARLWARSRSGGGPSRLARRTVAFSGIARERSHCHRGITRPAANRPGLRGLPRASVTNRRRAWLKDLGQFWYSQIVTLRDIK
jgi:hypothetical protein